MNNAEHRKNLCFVTTSPMTISAFLRPHLLGLSSKYDVTVVTNLNGFPVSTFGLPEIRFRNLDLRRDISPIADFFAFVKLCRILRQSDFAAVVTVTPKAGLLGSLSSAFAKVPVRIHWFTGQVWANKRFPLRHIMKLADRVILTAATSALVDGFSQRDFLVQQKVGRAESFKVLLNGSISGVDCVRFTPNLAKRTEMRLKLGLKGDVFTVIFLGRLKREKGVLELATAFTQMDISLDSSLLFVGPDEDRVTEFIKTKLEQAERRVTFVPHTDFPEDYLVASDVMCLPSTREGFGTSVIEASAVGLPVAVSDIYGLRDSVLEGKTGVVFPSGSISAMSQALGDLANAPDLRIKLGSEGVKFAREKFAQDDVVSEFHAFIEVEILKLNPRTSRNSPGVLGFLGES